MVEGGARGVLGLEQLAEQVHARHEPDGSLVVRDHHEPVRPLQEQVAQRFQEIEPVVAQRRVLGVDHHAVEECIDRCAKRGQPSQGSRVIAIGEQRFEPISIGEDRAFIRACHRRGISTFSADRFNFTQVRSGDNTWLIDDQSFRQGTLDVDTSDDTHRINR